MNSWKMNKNLGFIAMAIIVSLRFMPQSRAMPDQDAGDMLTATSQEENSDAVVKWGESHNKKTHPVIAPISESSFTSNGPVNTVVGGGRAPASVTIPSITAEESKMATKTIVRNLVKRKAYQEVAVIVNDLGFFPANLFVTQGIPVRLFVTGASKKSQCFMMDAYGIRRQIQNQKVEEIIFTPEETGSFTFSCPMNGAKGNLLVKELEIGRMPAGLNVSKQDDE